MPVGIGDQLLGDGVEVGTDAEDHPGHPLAGQSRNQLVYRFWANRELITAGQDEVTGADPGHDVRNVEDMHPAHRVLQPGLACQQGGVLHGRNRERISDGEPALHVPSLAPACLGGPHYTKPP